MQDPMSGYCEFKKNGFLCPIKVQDCCDCC